MDVSTLSYVATYLVVAATALILSVYFLRDYGAKKLRASLAWGLAFALYCPAALVEVFIRIAGEVKVGWGGIIFGLAIVTLAMTLFYYGASLLFFNPGSFFRGRMTLLIFLIYVVYYSYVVSILPLEGFRTAVAPYSSIGGIFPIFLTVSALFYRVSGRIAPGDPRRRTVLLVSSGWLLGGLVHLYLGLSAAFLTISLAVLDPVINVIHALAWILILYGMVYAKVART